MISHRKYDPTIPLLFITGKEHLLDEQFRKSIPRSTVFDWKNGLSDNYFGSEYRLLYTEAFDRELLLAQYQTLKKTVDGIMRIWISMSQVVIPFLHNDKKRTAWLVDHTQQLMKIVPKQIALKIMGFSHQTFQYRIQSLLACSNSAIGQCIKRNSRQLSSVEIKELRTLFTNKDMVCWPMVSLYYYGLRAGKISMGLSTFYKYAKLLNLLRKPIKPAPKPEGIKTTAPNQYLHVDTTYWKLDSGMKSAIVFASDNFSKFITGFKVAERNAAKNVADVLRQTVETILDYHPRHRSLTKLVADGGSENHAIVVAELIANNKRPPIQKLIAKTDIEFSNSAIEAINKIFKRYLRYFKPRTLEELIAVVGSFVHDYNTVRPHGKLKGLTPQQAYQGFQPRDFSGQIAQAQNKRIAMNKGEKCALFC